MTTGILDLKADWGPFSPATLGVSRILEKSLGIRADLALFAARRDPLSVIVPDCAFDYVQNKDTGERRTTIMAVPEDVAPDYRSFALRYFFDETSGDTALARFTVESSERVRCEMTFHNSSSVQREYVFGMALAVEDPRKPIRLKPSLDGWWLPARAYSDIEAYQRVFGLGCRQCLTRVFTWGLEEQVLAQAFGGWAGDSVRYRFRLPRAVKDGVLYLRYVKYGKLEHPWEIRIGERSVQCVFPRTWALTGNAYGKNRDAYEEWRLLRVPFGSLPADEFELELRPIDPPENDHARIWLDGILFSDGRLPGDEGGEPVLPVSLTDEVIGSQANVKLESAEGRRVDLSVSAQDRPGWKAAIECREADLAPHSGEDSFLADVRRRFGQPPVAPERDAGLGAWAGAEAAPVVVPARARQTVSFALTIAGNSGETETSAPAHTVAGSAPPRGPHARMIARLRDALLFDVNYPFSMDGPPSHFIVPSKYFPIPYSWDGGLAAVGLATFHPVLAREEAAYFMADASRDYPMVTCGSPVPTPLYALWDVYQQTQDTEYLARTYEGARRMHDFYMGRTPGSVAHAHGDGLLSTYPYNYNLGIDDHPVQLEAEETGRTRGGLYSIILMPQILRTARILRNVAELLGREEDAAQFGEDVALLAGAIDGRMWDEESGLYGWLVRNADGQVEPMRLDGCAGDRSGCAFLPLFAGLAGRKERLIEALTDPSRFWTAFGISSVDMAAPSFNPDGYWNGAVWPVMQWFIWRGLLEAGEPALARRLAEAILTTWQNAFVRDRYLGEHFVLKSARMSGAPNFGGLSAVLLPMHAAYYTPYQVTPLYDVAIHAYRVDKEAERIELTLSAPYLEAAEHDLLVNMGRARAEYRVIRNGAPWRVCRSDEFGHLCLRFPRPDAEDSIRIEP